jgi:hypothetical protein
LLHRTVTCPYGMAPLLRDEPAPEF